MNCLSRNIKVEGSKLVNVKHQKSILLERCLCALSIGDLPTFYIVHHGRVSKFDILMCSPKFEISYFLIGNLFFYFEKGKKVGQIPNLTISYKSFNNVL